MKVMKRVLNRIWAVTFRLFPMLALNYRIRSFIRTKMEAIDYNEKVFRDDLKEQYDIFLTEAERNDKEYVENLTKDIVRCYLLWKITPDEYFLHDFRNKSENYKSSILSRAYKDELSAKALGSEFSKYFYQLKDKWLFYEIAKPYFKRDVCRVEDETDLNSIEDFCKKHKRFIAKPRLSSSGIGVHVVDLQKDGYSDAKKILDHYQHLDSGKWMFEEFIEQDPVMAAWHPASVNTIRVPSVRTKKGCKIILPLFRTGKNGNLVDNCHNDGGLMSVPDANTGIIVTDGYDIYTNVVELHPNSGIKFKGWKVPRWAELVKTASDLHMSLPPKHKYIGFDFALTKDGWAVVEGNWGNFPHQVCVQHGIRKEFEKLMKS